jgi:hypothetical protein
MFTAFSMSSIERNIMIIFLLVRNPKTPIIKTTALSIRYQFKGTMT